MIPICGEDFCDSCGDCLACYGEDVCYATLHDDQKHLWVKLEPQEDIERETVVPIIIS
jgi:hypothetical protein